MCWHPGFSPVRYVSTLAHECNRDSNNYPCVCHREAGRTTRWNCLSPSRWLLSIFLWCQPRCQAASHCSGANNISMPIASSAATFSEILLCMLCVRNLESISQSICQYPNQTVLFYNSFLYTVLSRERCLHIFYKTGPSTISIFVLYWGTAETYNVRWTTKAFYAL